jgi:hypothetical protein
MYWIMFLGPILPARAETCLFRLPLISASAEESGGNGPLYDLPGIATIKAIKPTSSATMIVQRKKNPLQ